jgi:AAA15 family ATPase/GTPase
MLQKIHIQNFRCFEDFKAEGFERVNLIGGKNNSGKSCLLEGIISAIQPKYIPRVAGLRNQQIQSLINTNTQKNSIIKYFNFSYRYNGYDEIYQCNFNSIDNKVESETSTLENELLNIDFVSQKKELPEINLVSSFDDFAIKKLKPQILEIIHKIDSRITDITSYSSKGNTLYVSQENEEDKEIKSFGDATVNIIKYFTPIFKKIVNDDKEISILLIDEIENGIHYTAHNDFWTHLFELCKLWNVQVFATTHSLEMIKAFNAVALKEGEGAYFEMMRDIDTNEIFVEKHDPEFLKFELANPKHTVRGE